jgi:hypothetical protein
VLSPSHLIFSDKQYKDGVLSQAARVLAAEEAAKRAQDRVQVLEHQNCELRRSLEENAALNGSKDAQMQGQRADFEQQIARLQQQHKVGGILNSTVHPNAAALSCNAITGPRNSVSVLWG